MSFSYPLFRHVDFTRIDATSDSQLGECPACGTIFRIASPRALAAIDAFYHTDEYAQHDEIHAISVPGSAEPVSVSRVQAQTLVEFLPRRSPRILDFGCFNGRLLREFAERRPDAILVGYDVAQRSGFPRGAAFSFKSGDWRDLEGPFDLVCLSHSIQYVREIGDLLDRIRDWIGTTGKVFVQTPDISKKGCALLLGDVHYHFSQGSMEALMARKGFGLRPLTELPFPRDAIVVGVASTPSSTRDPELGVLKKAVEHIRDLFYAVREHANERVDGILGTTIEASFVDELLEQRPCFFVDENRDKLGQPFRGRRVLPPSGVPAGAKVLVPLGNQSGRIAARLSERLPAEFVPV